MNGVLYLLLAGMVAGILAASMALAVGFGWFATFGFYVLGGNIGLLLTGALIARARSDEDLDIQATEE